MPLKKPTLKNQQQIEELRELLQWRLDTYRPCECHLCIIDRMLYRANIDALCWALGKSSKELSQMIQKLKKERVRETKHQHAHSE